MSVMYSIVILMSMPIFNIKRESGADDEMSKVILIGIIIPMKIGTYHHNFHGKYGAKRLALPECPWF
ncbi:MAG: hypothetical protein A3F17_01785 [Gammaproteobacteria bacterium RIFCSPHIGHO2_12_FULL_41_15]|nr:MAG: hypothetical protein A3F17_01785 [Gammaproteobacteria bacterium RIFCSPHIGHO2_12_FULL_41_15]